MSTANDACREVYCLIRDLICQFKETVIKFPAKFSFISDLPDFFNLTEFCQITNHIHALAQHCGPDDALILNLQQEVLQTQMTLLGLISVSPKYDFSLPSISTNLGFVQLATSKQPNDSIKSYAIKFSTSSSKSKDNPQREAIYLQSTSKDQHHAFLSLSETSSTLHHFIQVSPEARGGDLLKLVQRYWTKDAYLQIPNMATIFSKLLFSLDYLHNHLGTAHLDIKLENIFLDEYYNPILGDLGMAHTAFFLPNLTTSHSTDDDHNSINSNNYNNYHNYNNSNNINENNQDTHNNVHNNPPPPTSLLASLPTSSPAASLAPTASASPASPATSSPTSPSASPPTSPPTSPPASSPPASSPPASSPPASSPPASPPSSSLLYSHFTSHTVNRLWNNVALPPFDLNSPQKQPLPLLFLPYREFKLLEHKYQNCILTNGSYFDIHDCINGFHLTTSSETLQDFLYYHYISTYQSYSSSISLQELEHQHPRSEFANQFFTYLQTIPFVSAWAPSTIDDRLFITFSPNLSPEIYSMLIPDSYSTKLFNVRLKIPYGTKSYMAPEVLTANSQSQYDPYLADVYCLGLVFFTLLYGTLPNPPTTWYQKLLFFANEPFNPTPRHSSAPMVTKFARHLRSPFEYNASVLELLDRMMDFNPLTRITIKQIIHEYLPFLNLPNKSI